MQTTRTIRCKLSIDSADFPALNELFFRYAKACTKIAQWGQYHKESNAIRLHHALYKAIRSEFGLPANLVSTALRRASGTLKTSKMHGKFVYRPTLVALDARTFRLILKAGDVSFSTHVGRRRAKLDIGSYQRLALEGQVPTYAILVRARDGFYCNIVIQTEVPDAVQGNVLGIDLGIRNLAATSAGRKKSGTKLRAYRENRWRVRASLQSKGTRGARRALRRLSGRERRHAAWVNHNLAKAIVEEAVRNGCGMIRMEDLKGIRKRTKVPNKHLNRMVALWAYGQLQDFVAYKASLKGISIEKINPAYTSKTCHKCKKEGLRDRETFVCTPCGVTMDADVNAALVIAAGGAEPGAIPGDRNAARIADQIVEFFSHTG